MGEKGFRKVPGWAAQRVTTLDSNAFQIGALKRFSLEEISAGVLSHLGVEIRDGGLRVPARCLPSGSRGRYSRWNLTGKEIVRKDLPKVPRTWGWTSPNFGDWNRGSHYSIQTRLAYQREQLHGQQLEIIMELAENAEGFATIAFRVDRVFDRSIDMPERDLIFALSLLQENVGDSTVLDATMTTAQWAQSVVVDWEFFPVGTREQTVELFMTRLRAGRNEISRQTVMERTEAFVALAPSDFIYGTSGLQRYIGAKFSDTLIVFENMQYGNALYVMFEDWRELSKKSRIELLAGEGRGFQRIPHRKGWEERLKAVVESRLATGGI